MDMLPNCTKDACNGFHKSAKKKQFYDATDRCTWGRFFLVFSLAQESSEFYQWVRNHKDKIRLGLLYPGDGKTTLWSCFYYLCR